MKQRIRKDLTAEIIKKTEKNLSIVYLVFLISERFNI